MSNIQSYFTPYANDIKYPNPAIEEYKYSLVINKLKNIDLAIQGQELNIPWESDYTFHADYKQSNMTMKTYDELAKNFHRHKTYFKQVSLTKDNHFYEINCEENTNITFTSSKGSVLTDKIYIKIPENKSVQIYINFLTEENSLAIPMIFVEAQKDSHVEIVYIVESQYNKGALIPLFELIAHDKTHISLQTFTESIDIHRLSYIGYCSGESSHIDLRTSFYLQQKETCDLFVRMYHEGANSTSNQMIKTATLDSSTMNFNGLILANKDAHNIYAYQMLKGMLLSDTSAVYARPQLDIEYFELACSHGVSIGGFDDEELFYLKSRGIPNKEVYPLLLYGFFSEPFIDTPLEKYWLEKIKNLLGIVIN